MEDIAIKSQNLFTDLGPNLKVVFVLGTVLISPIANQPKLNSNKNFSFSQQIYPGQDINSDIFSNFEFMENNLELEKIDIIKQFAKKLISNSEELSSDIIKLVDDNFWELG